MNRANRRRRRKVYKYFKSVTHVYESSVTYVSDCTEGKITRYAGSCRMRTGLSGEIARIFS
jgi:hypothetical protein